MFRTNKFLNYHVRKASLEDLPKVVEVLKQAAQWLHHQGIEQWEYLRNGGEDKEIKQEIINGNTYVVVNQDGEVVLTVNLSHQQNEWDVEMWGEKKDAALYLHRLAVHSNYRKQKIGQHFLRWLNANILFRGPIRLDCVGNNVKLNQIYKESGFHFTGFRGEGSEKFSLYVREA